MNLNKHERKLKHFLKLNREYNVLIRKKWSIEPVKLDKPIHNGFIRFLRIRPEYYKHVDYKIICNAFQLIGSTNAYSKTKDFLYRDKRKKIVHGEKHAHLNYFIDPRFRYYITEARRNTDIQRIEECKNYIKFVPTIFQCNCKYINSRYKDFIPHYEFAKPWILEEKTDINWLTHYTPVDGDIESRMKKISQYMDQYKGWEKISGRYKDDYNIGIIFLKDKIHGYLHGWPRPRIDELYEWETTFRLDSDSD